MPAPYSLDLRQRVWAFYREGGHTRAETADHCKVSESFVRDLLRRARETEGRSVAAKPHGGGWPAPATQKQLVQIQEALERQSDATLAELQKALRRRHRFAISSTSLWRVLGSLGLTRKKEGSARRGA